MKDNIMSDVGAMHRKMRNAYRILVGRSEGKRPFGRPKRKWENNIKTDVGKIMWDGIERTPINTVIKL
jgi:hypothetical protein